MWKISKHNIAAEQLCHYQLHPIDSYLQDCLESADSLPQAELWC